LDFEQQESGPQAKDMPERHATGGDGKVGTPFSGASDEQYRHQADQ
jgi:hypothetical protein